MADADVENVTAALENLLGRHRRERKELQAKIQELKKNAPKSDKKKRKETMEEVARLEFDLEQRQAQEIKTTHENQDKEKADKCSQDAKHSNGSASVPAAFVDSDKETNGQQQRVSKAQKRREKKAREQKEREEEILAAAAEDNQFEPKSIEARNMKAKLKERQLALHHISSDGDCLYNAIRHQVLQSGVNSIPLSVKELRIETANYIKANKSTLICYMTNPQTGDLLNDDEFDKYCEAVRSTSAWGGQIELKALSSILKVPIEVIQSEGPSTIQGADEFAGPNLTITYHRHMYSLGEHYNSTVPLSEATTTSDDDNAE